MYDTNTLITALELAVVTGIFVGFYTIGNHNG